MTAPQDAPAGPVLAKPARRREWAIDVCRTCDRLAVWPYCAHRPSGYVPPSTPPWYEIVTVREVGRR